MTAAHTAQQFRFRVGPHDRYGGSDECRGSTRSPCPALDIPTPSYDRAALRIGIVHFGVGGFHRAHQAMYLDRLMNSGPGLDWAICGVGVLPSDRRMHEVMQDQDGLYTLVVKHPDGQLEPRVIGSMADYLFAPDDPEAVVARMADPGTRIVSLTVTEGGYHVHPVSGDFDDRDENIQHDLKEPAAAPRTTFGFIAAALRRRREAGTAPFTVMSCDNIQGNGDVAHKMVTAFARLQDPELAEWIEREVPFPNSMVDRITPVTSDEDREVLSERFDVQDGWPVVCEPFTQWVLEDHFADGRPEFDAAGVQLVPDVMPYELMKLRLLNASHQALCYLGYLSGYRYANEVCSGRAVRRVPARLHEPGGHPDPAAGAGRGPGGLQAAPDRAVRQPRGARHPGPAVRGEQRPDPQVAAAGDPAQPGARRRDRPGRRWSSRPGPATPRASTSRASRSRWWTGWPSSWWPAARRQREEPLAFISDRDLFGDLAGNERFAGGLPGGAGLPARRGRPGHPGGLALALTRRPARSWVRRPRFSR